MTDEERQALAARWREWAMRAHRAILPWPVARRLAATGVEPE